MFRSLILASFTLASLSAFGWGAKGHQIVSYVGASLATDGQAFWGANLDPMRQLSTVPDRLWKTPDIKPQEGHQHFFQIDSYFTPAQYAQIPSFPRSYSEAVTKYGESEILRNGTAPWRIRQLYKLALQEFKSGDMKSALEHAGAMSHYIGDLSQPLHVTENFNGQFTGDSGIHSYFETTIIVDEMAVRADVQKRAQALLQDKNFIAQFRGSLGDAVMLEIERSIAFKDQIIQNDKQYGRSAQGAAVQLELAKDRLADGAATLSVILNQLWKDSGLVANATPLTIEDPSWVEPDFSQLSMSRKTVSDEEDDCLQ